MNIIQELKRRNVFKVAIAYLVVGWLAIQVIVNVTVPLSLPDWAPSLVIVLLAIGFPIALIFAWAFELTPDGIKKSKYV
ncbi:MAG: adenylyl cyclase, partial [Gammaproteobacteria bacterium]|nr:adenylyl cyclase [Gammaproteobacteria bacterium]